MLVIELVFIIGVAPGKESVSGCALALTDPDVPLSGTSGVGARNVAPCRTTDFYNISRLGAPGGCVV
ncbi:hypothetical protein K443DRAFT_378283 [Laccaria amethystina LaAM-08-1]|jgi:hypothetical protein|uniref:Uncharacterized protein n=1 Tax=Laccaria amethystina LaAM-08-1 TaxID=1095629 RepID=A0A0C9YAF1_9AGAR|nr:hypothetical protein K443DRAFT_378283 [Laccaria amethystina LaAM-08-1]